VPEPVGWSLAALSPESGVTGRISMIQTIARLCVMWRLATFRTSVRLIHSQIVPTARTDLKIYKDFLVGR